MLTCFAASSSPPLAAPATSAALQMLCVFPRAAYWPYAWLAVFRLIAAVRQIYIERNDSFLFFFGFCDCASCAPRWHMLSTRDIVVAQALCEALQSELTLRPASRWDSGFCRSYCGFSKIDCVRRPSSPCR